MSFTMVTIASLLLLTLGITAEHCLDPADSQDRGIPFTSSASPSLPKSSQVIISSYKFSCHGKIYSWHTYVLENEGSGSAELRHNISFQVWRPSSGVEMDGCYNFVGENIFRNILAEKDGLISVTVQPSDTINVSPGDVIGYYADATISGNADISSNNNTEIKLDKTYTNESVWYHVNTPEDPLINSGSQTCLFAVGASRMLESHINAAPVISIDMVPATINPTPTTYNSGTQFVVPTSTPGGLQPQSGKFTSIYIIIIVLALLLLFILLLIFVLVLIVMAIRRKKERKRLKSHTYSEIGNSTDPLYEALGTVPQVSTSEVAVAPNESYGLVDSPTSSVTYDSVNVTIKQSYKNLAITLP